MTLYLLVVFLEITPLFSNKTSFLLMLTSGISVSSLSFLLPVTTCPRLTTKPLQFLSLLFADKSKCRNRWTAWESVYHSQSWNFLYNFIQPLSINCYMLLKIKCSSICCISPTNQLQRHHPNTIATSFPGCISPTNQLQRHRIARI